MRPAETLARRDWLPSLARVSASLAATLIYPVVVLAALLLATPLRERLRDDAAALLTGLRRDSFWPLAVVLVVAVGALVFRHPFPPDDLARDLVAHFVDDDYRRMFWASPGLPGFDLYPGFDWLLGWLQPLPAAWRALPAQLVPLLGLLAVTTAALYRAIPAGRTDRRTLIAGLLLLLLLMPGVTTRIAQGRPEVDFAVWALSALILPAWAWFLIGLVMTPLYWLAPVYGAGALLLQPRNNRPWATRLAFGLAFGLASAALWMILTDGQWWRAFATLHRAAANRIGTVAEDATPWEWLDGTGALVFAVLAWRCRHGFRIREDRDLYAVLAVFLIPDMIRYTDILSPLLLLLLARAAGRLPPPEKRTLMALRVLVVWAAIVLLPLGFPGGRAPPARFLARVGSGDRVLTPFSPLMFRSAFAAVPHGGVLAPAMEVGFTTRAVQRMASHLEQGEVNCAQLRHHHVRWVVEDTLRGAIPSCLSLDSVDGGVRAWRVRHP